MELFFTALSALVAGAGLVWTIFKFYTERRDKQRDEERAKFYKDFYAYQDRMEKEFEGTRAKVEELSHMVSIMSTALEVQKEKFSFMTEKFTDYSAIVRRTLERHSEELISLGKVIRVGDK